MYAFAMRAAAHSGGEQLGFGEYASGADWNFRLILWLAETGCVRFEFCRASWKVFFIDALPDGDLFLPSTALRDHGAIAAPAFALFALPLEIISTRVRTVP